MKPSRPDPSRANKLRSIQRAFASAVMRPLTADYRMKPKWNGKSTRKIVSKFIKPNDRLNSFERIEIYNKQYWFRLLDCLYEDFPGLRMLIGEKRFMALSIAYLQKYPSNSYALRDLGNRLLKFVVQEPRWIAPHLDLARDILRLEWAHIVAFDGEWMPSLEIDDLLGSDPAKLQLGIQPCVTFLALDYPIDDFIIKIRRREEPQGEASNAVSEPVKRKAVKKVPLPKPEKIWLAVHRSNYSVYYKRLEPEAYVLLTALQKGATLQVACEKAFRRKKADPDFGTTLQGWFAHWASFGWFCRAE